MAVDPLQRVGGSKREHARQHLVQGDTQRVEIAAGIDRAIHTPGLFRGHVGQAAGNEFRRRRRLALAWQSGGDTEAGEPDVTGVTDEYVRGLDILVDLDRAVGVAKRRCQVNGKGQKTRPDRAASSSFPIENAVERLTAWVD